jgi:hypothetical protein
MMLHTVKRKGRRDRIHFFELRLDQLPKLQLDGARSSRRLTSPVELQSMALTGLLAAYLTLPPVA